MAVLGVRCVSWAAMVMLVATARFSGQVQKPALAVPLVGGSRASDTAIAVDSAMQPPAWALAQRRLIAANAEGAAMFAAKYIDANGYFRSPAVWGTPGPARIETIRNWPLAHALGGDDSIIDLFERVWEGHVDQYTKATDPTTDLARNGMLYKEFLTGYDWQHIGEGLGPFYWYGLNRPTDRRYQVRMRRFAGFYMNEDPDAPNYDAVKKLIRSAFNGSRGPKLDELTQADWNGQTLPGQKPSTRFLKATNLRGDHPMNLAATNLAFHAYLLTHDPKYRRWLLEYVDAWMSRIDANQGNIPSNIGLDGRIGGEWGGKWYGGVFGWSSPDEGARNYVLRGPPEGFGNAFLLTGDRRYTQVLRRQLDNLYSAAKHEGGTILLPRYHADNGWYGFKALDDPNPGGLSNLIDVALELYLWSLDPRDLERLPKRGWVGYLASPDPTYPLTAIQQALEDVRRAGERLRSDTSTYDFPVENLRGAGANPVATTALINLTLGGNDPNGETHGPMPLHAQVRHFDPDRRRAGLPPDVAALVERIRPDGISLTLVNTHPLQHRTLTVQMGAYGEHLAQSVTVDDRTIPIEAPYFHVRLAPGAGATVAIAMQRHVNQPTLVFPWDRGWMVRK